MPRPVALFTDDELLDGLARHGRTIAGMTAYAAEVGCSLSLVRMREARHRRNTGGKVRDWDCSWDWRLRYRPTLAEIARLERTDGASTCIERWGAHPSTLRKFAPDRKKVQPSVPFQGHRPCGNRTESGQSGARP